MNSTLADVVREHARHRPDAAAISCGDITLTFSELDRRSSQVANALAATGVGHGDRVAVLDKNSPAFFEVAFGCSKLGAVLVALNWRLAPPEIAAIVSDAKVSVLLVGEKQRDVVPADRPVARTVVMGEDYDQWMGEAEATDPFTASSADDVVLQRSAATSEAAKGTRESSAMVGCCRSSESPSAERPPAIPPQNSGSRTSGSGSGGRSASISSA